MATKRQITQRLAAIMVVLAFLILLIWISFHDPRPKVIEEVRPPPTPTNAAVPPSIPAPVVEAPPVVVPPPVVVAPPPPPPEPPVIESPNPWYWLERFQGSVTRAEFQQRLVPLLDPFGGLAPYIVVTDESVTFYPAPVKATPSPAPSAPRPTASSTRSSRRGSRSRRNQDSAPAAPKVASRPAASAARSLVPNAPAGSTNQPVEPPPVAPFDPSKDQIPQFVLRFAPNDAEKEKAPRTWRTPAEYRATPKPAPGRPLEGLRIAIDPGHIGGEWGQIENRAVNYHGWGWVREGDLNIITARLLRPQLEALGASVYLVREDVQPVTPYRPADFRYEARQRLLAKSPDLAARLAPLPVDVQERVLGDRLTTAANYLFYRRSEIWERGSKIRRNFTPDITITLYINATAASGHGGMAGINRNIFFVHGSYTKDELTDASQRLRLLYKLLDNPLPTEITLAENISKEFTLLTGYPPVKYGDSKTTREVIPGYKYVVARNLVANREYDGPVVASEPYFMNEKVSCQRFLAGDYEGERIFFGKPYRSIFREYADGVLRGIMDTYADKPPEPEPSAAPIMDPDPTPQDAVDPEAAGSGVM